MRIVAGDFRQVDLATDASVIKQLGDRVGQAAGAHVVHADDRVRLAKATAGIDDFLTAALHLGVIALHRGVIQLGAGAARRDRRSRAAAQPDQHRRAAQHDDFVARLHGALQHVARTQVGQAAGQHDRLVIAAAQAGFAGFVLVGAEIAAQTRTTKLVVERGRTQRAVAHDLERAGHARRQRAVDFPRLRVAGNTQIGHRKTGEASFGLAAATGGALVANFAAGAGGRTGPRRDRGRVVVRLHLDRKIDALFMRAPDAVFRIGEKALADAALDHRRVVRIRGQGMRRRLLVRVLDHAEQALILIDAVQRPTGVEHLVPAMLGVGLCEHEKLGIGWVAAQFGVAVDHILDFIVSQGQTETAVRFIQRALRVAAKRDMHQIPGLANQEQALGLVDRRQHRLRHRVVQFGHDHGEVWRAGRRQAGDLPGHAALDPANVGAFRTETGTMQDFRGLTRPRRDGA